jgi:hypothetical protein
MIECKNLASSACCLATCTFAPLVSYGNGSENENIKQGQMSGYLIVPNEKVPQEFGGGFSMYVAAWPLLDKYPGNKFQTGLFGTWMFPQYEEGRKKGHYTDIEGGLGWWRDTRFATVTPKFIMGGVALNFSAWANGPGAGKGRSWKQPKGKYGVAQLSPYVIWPPDGLNLKQGTCGELFGYGYLPLPLADPKEITAGKKVPTGNNCWTLFLNSGNFKGPVAFFTPYFWSRVSVKHPEFAGKFLDSRPSEPNRALQMETQYVPGIYAKDSKGNLYARVAPVFFPKNQKGETVVVHRITSYSKNALWDSVDNWFKGGRPSKGSVDSKFSIVHKFTGRGGSTWRIYSQGTQGDDRIPLEWDSFAEPETYGKDSFGYKWNKKLIKEQDGYFTLPEFYKLVDKKGQEPQWVVVSPGEIPPETGIVEADLELPGRKGLKPYVTPEDPESCWKTPGPVSGPFKAYPGDGTEVTYYWYRFADQPALLNADLTAEEREKMQKRVEMLHKKWKKDQDYLPPPEMGELADIDPALIVQPPKGYEAGYVPIVTKQGLRK